jgi:predicted ester cyclase
MSKENKFLIRRYLEECLAKNDMPLLDELRAAYYVLHEPSLGDLDLQAYKRFQPSVLAAFPGGHWVIENMVAEADKVAWRWTFCGTPPRGVHGRSRYRQANSLEWDGYQPHCRS